MSSGHRQQHALSSSEIADLLAEAMANPKIRSRLARSFRVDIKCDIPLLGSSSIGGGTVYIDRHLRFRDWPYGVLPVDGRRLDVRPGLIRHEKLESAAEDILGWPYTIAHAVAQHYEENDYTLKKFDPREVERAFAPYIRTDEVEPLSKVPTDLDLRPALGDAKLLTRIRVSQDAQKRPHDRVGYVAESKRQPQRCELCAMFVREKFGGPACTGVKDKISPLGYCRRFKRGALESD